MIESSYGLNFYLKTHHKGSDLRYIYLRITVDGIQKETSTKRKWEGSRWNQKIERATGTKEDAKALNSFLDSIRRKVEDYKIQLINRNTPITSQKLVDFVLGNTEANTKVLEEFQKHNDEILALVSKGEYSKGTHERYVTARSHVQQFIKLKYKVDDLEFRQLNYEFVKDFDFFLRTIRNCQNNSTVKYIANFKKIVYRAISKDIIASDPFKAFNNKKVNVKKTPLSSRELFLLENKVFESERLNEVRDIFVFQCYTGLSYIDVKQLRSDEIKIGIDNKQWIISSRQKTGSSTTIPLLSKAIEILEKYKHHKLCIKSNVLLPVKSNQKMNEYLKEIATLCNINDNLTTHKARRTFGSTVTLNNGVPMHVVKEMLGHQSIKQTEEYALTEQATISREMDILDNKISSESELNNSDPIAILKKIENDINQLTLTTKNKENSILLSQLQKYQKEIDRLKEKLF